MTSTRSSVIFATLALALSGSACEDSSGPEAPEQVIFRIDGSTFEIDPETGVAGVDYSVENPSSETVYVNACGDSAAPWADRHEDGRWTRFSVYECPSPLADRAVAAGSTVTGVYTLDEVGEYRLGLLVRAQAAGDESWLHVSDSFQVVGPTASPLPAGPAAP